MKLSILKLMARAPVSLRLLVHKVSQALEKEKTAQAKKAEREAKRKAKEGTTTTTAEATTLCPAKQISSPSPTARHPVCLSALINGMTIW
jgi:septal ring factor EnvC (AmiA/AmiB activator)